MDCSSLTTLLEKADHGAFGKDIFDHPYNVLFTFDVDTKTIGFRDKAILLLDFQ
jgi:hypothetical protein